jgi:hypothetical protein
MKDQIKQIIKEELKLIFKENEMPGAPLLKLRNLFKKHFPDAIGINHVNQLIKKNDSGKLTKADLKWCAETQRELENLLKKESLGEAEKKDTSAVDAAQEQHKKLTAAHNKLLSSYYAAKTPAAKKSIRSQIDASIARKKASTARIKALKQSSKD